MLILLTPVEQPLIRSCQGSLDPGRVVLIGHPCMQPESPEPFAPKKTSSNAPRNAPAAHPSTPVGPGVPAYPLLLDPRNEGRPTSQHLLGPQELRQKKRQAPACHRPWLQPPGGRTPRAMRES